MWFAADHQNQSRRLSGARRDDSGRVSGETPPFLVVDVECYAGHRGEETPRRFRLGDRNIEIVDVIDRWLAPDHRYFKVRDTSGDLYILRNDVIACLWEVTVFRSGQLAD